MAKRTRLITILAGVTLTVTACVALLVWWFLAGRQRERGVDQEKFAATAREGDARVARVYQLFPAAEARFNEGNRAGKHGAFAPIAQTYTLRAKLPGGYELRLYRGIAPRVVAPDGITVVEGAYGVQAPDGKVADLTPEEFDQLLDANGDAAKLHPEVWKRPPLPTKHL